MKLFCPEFEHNDLIPSRFTCDGQDISPPLQWEEVPPNTKSFVLIMDDPDAPLGTWVHWIIYNIPAVKNHLEENVEREGKLPGEMKQGRNSWRKVGYGGPCPPSGTHRYFFKLFALGKVLDLEVGINKKTLLDAMQGCTLESCELIGLYKRNT
jgi:Raf kinase inhibitor-like YbhB/YbcL family protein